MPPEDLDSTEEATFLIGEAIRRVMMREVKDVPDDLIRLAQDVMGKIVPAALMPDEFNLVASETGMYPPGFTTKYKDRFRKPD